MANRPDDPRSALPPPALEDLQAYADGTLDASRVADLELYLALHPDYQALVETYRAPDLRLQTAYFEKLEGLVAAGKKTAPAFWQKWADTFWTWFQTPVVRAGLLAAVVLLVAIPLLREQNQAVPEYEALALTQVRSGDVRTRDVGEILTNVKPSTSNEANLEYESIAGALTLLAPGPHTLQPGRGLRVLIQVSFDAGVDEAKVRAVLKSVVDTETFTLEGVDRRGRVLEALNSVDLAPNALSVSDVYTVGR